MMIKRFHSASYGSRLVSCSQHYLHRMAFEVASEGLNGKNGNDSRKGS